MLSNSCRTAVDTLVLLLLLSHGCRHTASAVARLSHCIHSVSALYSHFTLHSHCIRTVFTQYSRCCRRQSDDTVQLLYNLRASCNDDTVYILGVKPVEMMTRCADTVSSQVK
jgi:hypothetical protein